MKQTAIAKISEYLQSLQSEKANLESKLESLRNQPEVKKNDLRLTEIRGQIRTLKAQIADTQKMPDLAVNSYCQNQHDEIGLVSELKEESDKLLAVVKFENGTQGTYSPHNLEPVAKEQLDYIWLGEPKPKLIRKIDRKECDQIKVLKREEGIARAELDRAISFGQPENLKQTHQDKINYCVARKKALELKSANQHQPEEYDQLEIVSQPKQATKQIQKIAIANIERHPDCQQRRGTDPEVVRDYQETIKSGDRLPPLKVVSDGTTNWLWDGFHSIEAIEQEGFLEAICEVQPGNFRDAIRLSCGANAKHGKPRSRKTKHNSVNRLLQDEEWSKWSNCEIARQCNVSESFVRSLRKKDPSLRLNEVTSKNKHGVVSKMDTTNIGKNSCDQEEKPTSPEPSPEPTKSTPTEPKSSDKSLTINQSPTSEPTPKTPQNKTPERPANLQFEPNQLVLLDLVDRDRCDEELKAVNHSYVQIISKADIGLAYNIRVFGGSQASYSVKPEDLRPVSQATMTLTFKPEEYIEIMEIFETVDLAIDKAMLGLELAKSSYQLDKQATAK